MDPQSLHLADLTGSGNTMDQSYAASSGGGGDDDSDKCGDEDVPMTFPQRVSQSPSGTSAVVCSSSHGMLHWLPACDADDGDSVQRKVLRYHHMASPWPWFCHSPEKALCQ
jgi:hypothetical protein